MKRVTGIGGIFFKAKDPKTLLAWYKEHLGIDVEEWGGSVFHWKNDDRPDRPGQTVWSIFKDESKYFEPSQNRYMINYRVADLRGLVAALRAEGCNVDEKVEESEYGIFGWVVDPEGNKIELWEPPKKSPES